MGNRLWQLIYCLANAEPYSQGEGSLGDKNSPELEINLFVIISVPALCFYSLRVYNGIRISSFRLVLLLWVATCRYLL